MTIAFGAKLRLTIEGAPNEATLSRGSTRWQGMIAGVGAEKTSSEAISRVQIAL
jgi:hypothetical protein